MGTQPASYTACPNCRAALPAEARFCHHCGATAAAPQYQPQAQYSYPQQHYPAQPQYPQYQNNYQYQQYYPMVCGSCGGDGSRLHPAKVVCPECRWLRPLAPGWAVDPMSFMWSRR